MQKMAKILPSGHHRITVSGYIFATKACIANWKNVLNSTIFSTCLHNIANFGPLTAENCSGVWDTQHISTAFTSWQRYCMRL